MVKVKFDETFNRVRTLTQSSIQSSGIVFIQIIYNIFIYIILLHDTIHNKSIFYYLLYKL